MKITPHTKISAIIKANSHSIAAIASIAKPFQKLKNPILRRLMAPRVTVAEAAAIGGCTIADFKRVLEPLGFIITTIDQKGTENHIGENAPVWFSSLAESQTDTFDVRQIIDQGDDPLKTIMQRYHQLPIGHALCIINSFIPYPLLQVLGKKGARHYIQSPSDTLHHTWFFKEVAPAKPEKISNDHITIQIPSSFEKKLADYEPQYRIELDVRALPMPQPLEAILQAIPKLKPHEILYVYHKRVPLHLLEELEGTAYNILLCEYADDDIRLLISYETD